MSEPRVLLVTKGLDLGGVERMVADLAVGLQRRGVPVQVAVVNGRRDRLVSRIRDAQVTVHDLGGTDRIGSRAVTRLRSLARSGRFEVIHTHGPLTAVAARLSSVATPPHLVTTVHGSWSRLHPLTRAGWRATARLDDRLLAVSAGAAESLPRRWAERAVVVPHGVDLAELAAARAAATAARASVDAMDQPLVVTIASHRSAKNYPNLLRAVRVAIDRGARFRLVAVGDGARLDEDRRLAGALGLTDVVRFEAPRADAMSVIAAADVLIVASDHEGQPLVVLEALALGRPVVATAVGRVPELVGSSNGRVVPPSDPGALGAALAEVLADPTRYSTPAAEVRTLDDVLDDHLRIYRGMVGS